MKCLSLFSGIGGFDLAARNLGHEIVGACEIDKYARQIYANHFPQVKIWGDVKEIKPKELPDFDILFGGFPCQSFSIAGRRQGFMDTRGTLFFEIARIAKEKRPRFLLLENVKGLLNHESGNTFRTILSTLDEMGYDTEWQVINSKYFVPQNRERVFIIGHSRKFPRRQIFPIGEYDQVDNGTRSETQGKGKRIQEQNSSSLQTSPNKGTATLVYIAQQNANMKQRVQERDETWCLTNNSGDFGIIEREPRLKPLNNARQGYRVYDKEGIGQCLNSQCGGLGAKMGLVLDEEPHAVVNNRGVISKRERAQCLDANYWKGYDNHGARTLIAWSKSTRDWGVESRIKEGEANTLNTGEGCRNQSTANYVITEKSKIRRLTPLECERLQGFTDKFTEVASFINSVKLVGNIWQHVKLKNVKDGLSAENCNCVLNIIKDGENGVTQISLTTDNALIWENVKRDVIGRISVEDGVCDTINPGTDMVIHFNLNKISKIEMITKKNRISELMEKNNTSPYLKVILEENVSKEKLSITLTSIREIIKSQTFISVKTENPITVAIIIFRKLEQISSKEGLLDLKTETISYVSDTQRYKVLGNAVTVPVVEYILQHLNKSLKTLEDET